MNRWWLEDWMTVELEGGLGILDAQCIKTWQRTIWDWTSKTGHWTTKDRMVLLPDYCIFLNF